MKKIITIVIAAFLVGNMFVDDVILKTSAMETSITNEKHNSYSVSKEHIQKGNHFDDITLTVADENIKNETDYIEHGKDMCDGQISFELKDVVYDEEGHKFIITYWFDLNGERYESTIVFYLEETEDEEPKTAEPSV